MIDIDSSKYKVEIVNLKDFPITTLNNIVNGKNGIIEFYNVPKDTYVVSMNEITGSREYAKVKYWSIHKDRKIELVNLENGTQIITDDDPRAVLGITKENLENKYFKFERFTPTIALEKEVFVPIINQRKREKLLDYNELDLSTLNDSISSFDAALQALFDLYNVGLKACLTFKNKWQIYFPKETKNELYFSNEFSLSKVKSIEVTNQKENGYDLTVDNDNQNFLSFNGVVLSNTINVHVPGLPEAQKDIREKLMPSKQIYGIRNVPKTGKDGEPIEQEEVVNKLKQDLVSGLYATNKATPERKWLFRTEKEAIDAIKSGKVKLSDEVEILEK